MSDLSKYLMEMDSELFERDNSDYINLDDYKYTDSIIQEDVSPSVAKALIGNAFDPICSYQLVTMPYGTLLLKIDERVTADMENEGRHRITEFPLSSECDVQSYDEMNKSLLNYSKASPRTPTRVLYEEDLDKHVSAFDLKSFCVMFVLLIIFCSLLAVWFNMGGDVYGI